MPNRGQETWVYSQEYALLLQRIKFQFTAPRVISLVCFVITVFKKKQNWAFTHSLLNFLCHYSWPGTHDPSSSAFQMLRLYVDTTILSCLFCCCLRISIYYLNNIHVYELFMGMYEHVEVQLLAEVRGVRSPWNLNYWWQAVVSCWILVLRIKWVLLQEK